MKAQRGEARKLDSEMTLLGDVLTAAISTFLDPLSIISLFNSTWRIPTIGTQPIPSLLLEIETMRAKQLTKLLTLRLGVAVSQVSKILDRQELKAMALQIVASKQREWYLHEGYIVATKLSVVLFMIWFVWKIRGFLRSLCMGFWSSISELRYLLKSKMGMISICMKNRYVPETIALILAGLLDILSPLIQIRIMLSWILPSTSPIRVCLNYFVPMISLPISPKTILGLAGSSAGGGGGGAAGSQLDSMAGFGIDMGPVITISAINYTRKCLEEYAANKLIKFAQEKEARRLLRRQNREMKERLQKESLGDDWELVSNADFDGNHPEYNRDIQAELLRQANRNLASGRGGGDDHEGEYGEGLRHRGNVFTFDRTTGMATSANTRSGLF